MRLPVKQGGVGSNPTSPAIGTVAQLVEHLVEAQGVAGSRPVRST